MSKRNKKVIILVSPPAGGKTTYALNYLSKNPNTVRVNRDSFRFMLRDTPITENKVENLITDLSNEAILKALNKGFDVIVDNTHVKKKYIEDIIELVKLLADIEFVVLDCSLEKLLERDKNRQKSVGERVIKNMYKEFKILLETYPFKNIKQRPYTESLFNPLKQDENLPKAYIFDIDGNIAENSTGRSPFEWDKVDNDTPINIVIEQLKFIKNNGYKIVLVSGRDSISRKKTEYWLEFYEIPYDDLFMREENDFRKDSVVKKEIFNNLIKKKYNVLAAFDDRLQVCSGAWYELGIFCFCTNQGLKEY
jgi:predicted kinase